MYSSVGNSKSIMTLIKLWCHSTFTCRSFRLTNFMASEFLFVCWLCSCVRRSSVYSNRLAQWQFQCRWNFSIGHMWNKFARNVLKRWRDGTHKKRIEKRPIITPLSRQVIMQVTKQILYHLLSFLVSFPFECWPFILFFFTVTHTTPSHFLSDHKNRVEWHFLFI